LVQRAVRAVDVVVLDVLGEDCLEVTAAEDEHPVEALAPDGADHALTDGVRSGCPDRALDDPGALCGEDGVEGSRELGVAIADEELDRVCVVGEVHRDIAGLLGDPAGDRVGRDAGDPHATAVVVDEHEHVEPAEENGVDVEEVARLQTFRLAGEELRPGRSRPSRRWIDAVALQGRPDARGGYDDAHRGQLALDAAVAPLGILLRQPEHHGRGSLRDSRSTWPAVRVGPALGDEVSVPAQQGCRLDEEASASSAGEQSCQSGQHRSIRGLGRWSVHLASEDRHLVTQDHDLDSEVRISASNEADELKDAAVRAVEEGESHGPGCSPRPASAVKVQLTRDR